MGTDKEQRRGMFAAIYLCASLVGLGVGYDVGHAETKQEALLISSNKTLSSSVEAVDVPGNADKKLPMITKDQPRAGCLKTQDIARLVRLENHDNTGNYAHQELKADNIKVIDLDLQVTINTQWSEMIAALKEGDIEKTLRFISTKQREAARNDWTMLNEHLENLAENFSEPLQVTTIDGNRIVAQAMMPLSQELLQCPLEANFVLDREGQWRVRYD